MPLQKVRPLVTTYQAGAVHVNDTVELCPPRGATVGGVGGLVTPPKV
jgi:hypothetical protein